MINFIPNDPRAGSLAPGLRPQAARASRAGTKSGYTLPPGAPQARFPIGTPGFLFWQCREAAIAALEAWEASAGPHRAWQGNRKKLALRPDVGEDLNAFYDRASFSFFHFNIGGGAFFSGASTDVVAHEIGHGLLDSIRSDLWDVNFLEVGAFHEAFGDVMALLTALNDRQTRQRLLAGSTNLRRRNFVESTAEDLAEGIRRWDATHNAATPRRAFNTFRFQLPSTLPNDGGPGALINEVHSFGMLFTGCFWDLLANIFGAASNRNESSLLAAAKLAGKITIAGAKAAVVGPRFLQAVGRAMVLADETMHAGANRDHIRNAFQRHNILLGSNTMIAPSMTLAGAAPSGGGIRPITRRDLLVRLHGAPNAKLHLARASLFGTPVVRAVHTREVPLSGVDKRLKGVVARTPEPVMVGASGAFAAVVGGLPNASDTEVEVQSFVKSLVDQERIDLAKGKKRATKKKRDASEITHVIKTVGGKKVLQRVAFRCGLCRSSSGDS